MPLIAVTFFVIPNRVRWILLLSASLVFYAAFIPKYLIVLLFIVVVDYLSALLIERESCGRRKKKILWAAVALNLSVLFFFKYLSFTSESLNALSAAIGWNYSIPLLGIVLPLGISFYIFQGLSYIVEVYWGKQRAERHLGYLALYVSYFPQLVAGPIERPQHLLKQLRKTHAFEEARVVSGMRMMLWGFFQKLVIADRLAVFVDHIYANPSQFSSPFLFLATFFFAIQIYCDFAGYTDIAIGASRIFGIELMKNFRQPYFSKSIPEFWSRWHISLSTWFRDYVYIPLGGNRVSTFLWVRNILVTFLLSGLWHGANWTFVIWGLFHGGLFLLFRFFQKGKGLDRSQFSALKDVFAMLLTFCFVCLGWVFFRANNLGDAWAVILGMFGSWHFETPPLIEGFTSLDMVVSFLGILLLFLIHFFQEYKKSSGLRWESMPVWGRWGSYYALCFAIYILGDASAKKFIYFQF